MCNYHVSFPFPEKTFICLLVPTLTPWRLAPIQFQITSYTQLKERVEMFILVHPLRSLHAFFSLCTDGLSLLV